MPKMLISIAALAAFTVAAHAQSPAPSEPAPPQVAAPTPPNATAASPSPQDSAAASSSSSGTAAASPSSQSATTASPSPQGAPAASPPSQGANPTPADTAKAASDSHSGSDDTANQETYKMKSGGMYQPPAQRPSSPAQDLDIYGRT